jgi:hypothetical protein
MNEMERALGEAMRCNRDHPEVLLYFCELAVLRCKNIRRRGPHWAESMRFLGYTFRSEEEMVAELRIICESGFTVLLS